MVTGVEAAGLVLGSFPILVEGLKMFHNGVDTIKMMRRSKFEVVLRRFLRDIEIQSWTYHNTCQTLLGGLLTPAELDGLLKDPKGLKWKTPELETALSLRLGPGAADRFVVTAMHLAETLEEMKDLLGITQVNMVCHERAPLRKV